MTPPFFTWSFNSAKAAVVPGAPAYSKPISQRMSATLSPIAGVGARDRSTIPNGIFKSLDASCATSCPTRVTLNATAGKSGVSFMQAVREGGIFASLWELAERAGVGLHIDLMKIPMDQTVVEICNYYDLNPYEILSSGSALLFAKQGQQLCEELAAIGIPAAVIGQTTDGNDRIIQNGEEIRYLDLPKPDQIRKILNYTAKMASKGE